MDIKRDGSPDSNLNFYDQVVRVEKKDGWSKSLCSFIHCHIATWSRVAKWVNILQDRYYKVITVSPNFLQPSESKTENVGKCGMRNTINGGFITQPITFIAIPCFWGRQQDEVSLDLAFKTFNCQYQNVVSQLLVLYNSLIFLCKLVTRKMIQIGKLW